MGVSLIWAFLAFLVLVAGLAYRLRIHEEVRRRGTGLSDEQVRRIEEAGRLDVDDEPLDMDEIERAEDEFWEESWDEPEPW